MDVNGYEIDIANCSFKQTQQLILRFDGAREHDELFPVTYFMDNQTGEHSLIENDIAKKPNRGIRLDYYYVSDRRVDLQYDNVSKCLVFILVMLEARKLDMKLGEPLKYFEISRFYVTPNKNIIVRDGKTNEESGEVKWKFIERLERISQLPFNPTEYDMLNTEYAGTTTYKILNNIVGNVFNKAVVLAGNSIRCLNRIESIMEFLMYKEPSVRKGPLQKQIDEYCSIKLPEFLPEEKEQHNEVVVEGRLVRIKDNILCIQMFSVMQDRKTFYEAYRMYVSTDGKVITCKKNNFNQFVATTSALGGSHWRFSIDNYDETAVENTKLSYYKDIIKDIPSAYRGYAVWCFINHPVFERLYKMGIKESLNVIFGYGSDYPLGAVENHFSVNRGSLLNVNNIYASLGMNKHQLNRFIEQTKHPDFFKDGHYSSNLMYNLRYILTGDRYGDISSIDNDTFNVIFDMAVWYNPYGDDEITNALHYSVLAWGIKTVINNIGFFEMLYKNRDAVNMFHSYSRWFIDYIDIVRKMQATSEFKIKFDSLEDIKTAHDNVMYLYNLKKNHYQLQGFKEAVKRVEKYAYKDDNYEIIIPSEPNDMVREGNELHHCVKTYIDRVINGTTNIVFLRKAQELDIPFFTIEISNDGKIEQVHGLCNRNASTEPDMLYFLDDWMKKRKLKGSNYNKVR